MPTFPLTSYCSSSASSFFVELSCMEFTDFTTFGKTMVWTWIEQKMIERWVVEICRDLRSTIFVMRETFLMRTSVFEIFEIHYVTVHMLFCFWVIDIFFVLSYLLFKWVTACRCLCWQWWHKGITEWEVRETHCIWTTRKGLWQRCHGRRYMHDC